MRRSHARRDFRIAFAYFAQVFAYLVLLEGKLLAVLHVHKHTTAAHAEVFAPRFGTLVRAFEQFRHVGISHVTLDVIHLHPSRFPHNHIWHKHGVTVANAYRFRIGVTLGSVGQDVVFLDNFRHFVIKNLIRIYFLVTLHCLVCPPLLRKPVRAACALLGRHDRPTAFVVC